MNKSMDEASSEIDPPPHSDSEDIDPNLRSSSEDDDQDELESDEESMSSLQSPPNKNTNTSTNSTKRTKKRKGCDDDDKVDVFATSPAFSDIGSPIHNNSNKSSASKPTPPNSNLLSSSKTTTTTTITSKSAAAAAAKAAMRKTKKQKKAQALKSSISELISLSFTRREIKKPKALEVNFLNDKKRMELKLLEDEGGGKKKKKSPVNSSTSSSSSSSTTTSKPSMLAIKKIEPPLTVHVPSNRGGWNKGMKMVEYRNAAKQHATNVSNVTNTNNNKKTNLATDFVELKGKGKRPSTSPSSSTYRSDSSDDEDDADDEGSESDSSTTTSTTTTSSSSSSPSSAHSSFPPIHPLAIQLAGTNYENARTLLKDHPVVVMFTGQRFHKGCIDKIFDTKQQPPPSKSTSSSLAPTSKPPLNKMIHKIHISYIDGTSEWSTYPSPDSSIRLVSKDFFNLHIDGTVLYPTIGQNVNVKFGSVDVYSRGKESKIVSLKGWTTSLGASDNDKNKKDSTITKRYLRGVIMHMQLPLNHKKKNKGEITVKYVLVNGAEECSRHCFPEEKLEIEVLDGFDDAASNDEKHGGSRSRGGRTKNLNSKGGKKVKVKEQPTKTKSKSKAKVEVEVAKEDEDKGEKKKKKTKEQASKSKVDGEVANTKENKAKQQATKVKAKAEAEAVKEDDNDKDKGGKKEKVKEELVKSKVKVKNEAAKKDKDDKHSSDAEVNPKHSKDKTATEPIKPHVKKKHKVTHHKEISSISTISSSSSSSHNDPITTAITANRTQRNRSKPDNFEPYFVNDRTLRDKYGGVVPTNYGTHSEKFSNSNYSVIGNVGSGVGAGFSSSVGVDKDKDEDKTVGVKRKSSFTSLDTSMNSSRSTPAMDISTSSTSSQSSSPTSPQTNAQPLPATMTGKIKTPQIQTLTARRNGRHAISFDWDYITLTPNQEIEAMWESSGDYFPGVVQCVNSRRREVVVKYDDGDVEVFKGSVQCGLIRVLCDDGDRRVIKAAKDKFREDEEIRVKGEEESRRGEEEARVERVKIKQEKAREAKKVEVAKKAEEMLRLEEEARLRAEEEKMLKIEAEILKDEKNEERKRKSNETKAANKLRNEQLSAIRKERDEENEKKKAATRERNRVYVEKKRKDAKESQEARRAAGFEDHPHHQHQRQHQLMIGTKHDRAAAPEPRTSARARQADTSAKSAPKKGPGSNQFSRKVTTFQSRGGSASPSSSLSPSSSYSSNSKSNSNSHYSSSIAWPKKGSFVKVRYEKWYYGVVRSTSQRSFTSDGNDNGNAGASGYVRVEYDNGELYDEDFPGQVKADFVVIGFSEYKQARLRERVYEIKEVEKRGRGRRAYDYGDDDEDEEEEEMEEEYSSDYDSNNISLSISNANNNNNNNYSNKRLKQSTSNPPSPTRPKQQHQHQHKPPRLLPPTDREEKTKFNGVTSKNGMYFAKINLRSQTYVIGQFTDLETAARCYDDYCFDIYGDEYCNFSYGLSFDISPLSIPRTSYGGARATSSLEDDVIIGVTLLRSGEYNARIATRCLVNCNEWVMDIGNFDTRGEATRAYDQMCLGLRGARAICNELDMNFNAVGMVEVEEGNGNGEGSSEEEEEDEGDESENENSEEESDGNKGIIKSSSSPFHKTKSLPKPELEPPPPIKKAQFPKHTTTGPGPGPAHSHAQAHAQQAQIQTQNQTHRLLLQQQQDQEDSDPSLPPKQHLIIDTGVYLDLSNVWRSRLIFGNKLYDLGNFTNANDASLAYEQGMLALHAGFVPAVQTPGLAGGSEGGGRGDNGNGNANVRGNVGSNAPRGVGHGFGFGRNGVVGSGSGSSSGNAPVYSSNSNININNNRYANASGGALPPNAIPSNSTSSAAMSPPIQTKFGIGNGNGNSNLTHMCGVKPPTHALMNNHENINTNMNTNTNMDMNAGAHAQNGDRTSQQGYERAGSPSSQAPPPKTDINTNNGNHDFYAHANAHTPIQPPHAPHDANKNTINFALFPSPSLSAGGSYQGQQQHEQHSSSYGQMNANANANLDANANANANAGINANADADFNANADADFNANSNGVRAMGVVDLSKDDDDEEDDDDDAGFEVNIGDAHNADDEDDDDENNEEHDEEALAQPQDPNYGGNYDEANGIGIGTGESAGDS